LIAAGHIPKASYNAFKLLHGLGTERIKLETTSTIATRRSDGSLAIAVWNYTPPNRAGSHRRVRLVIKGPSSSNELRIHLVDRNNGSPIERWKRMGSPPFPTYEQQQLLRTVAELSPLEVHQIGDGETTTASLDLTPHSLALIEVKGQLG